MAMDITMASIHPLVRDGIRARFNALTQHPPSLTLVDE